MGPLSDLRPGLPWQMVEIHEPVRLAIVVEGGRDRLWRVVQGNAHVERLVRNRWVWLACLDRRLRHLVGASSHGFRPDVRPNTPLPSSQEGRRTGTRASAGFFLRLPSSRGDHRHDAGSAPPIAGDGRSRLASDSVRRARRRITRRPPGAGTVDGTARPWFDDGGVLRRAAGAHRARNRGNRGAGSLVRGVVGVPPAAASRSSSSSIGSRSGSPRFRRRSPASCRPFRIGICTASPATTAISCCWRCSSPA